VGGHGDVVVIVGGFLGSSWDKGYVEVFAVAVGLITWGEARMWDVRLRKRVDKLREVRWDDMFVVYGLI